MTKPYTIKLRNARDEGAKDADLFDMVRWLAKRDLGFEVHYLFAQWQASARFIHDDQIQLLSVNADTIEDAVFSLYMDLMENDTICMIREGGL